MFKSKRILVAGDFMLDIYTMGEVRRISPEAPVPIFQVEEQTRQPGGAGNVILNLISLGMEVVALGRIGDDEGGNHLLEALLQEDVKVSAIVRDLSFQTPLKKRVIAAGQQLVRIDYESPKHLSSKLEKQICSSFPTLLEGIDCIAISDYAKGFLTPSLLNELIDQARLFKIPVIVDPKGYDFLRYQGATILKPNLPEAIAAARIGEDAPLDEIAQRIFESVAVDILMITRSKEGISIFNRHKKQRDDFPTHVHELKDVTGAGDTVLAITTAALANEMELSEAAAIANIAAAIAIERVGCARISLAELTRASHMVSRKAGQSVFNSSLNQYQSTQP